MYAVRRRSRTILGIYFSQCFTTDYCGNQAWYGVALMLDVKNSSLVFQNSVLQIPPTSKFNHIFWQHKKNPLKPPKNLLKTKIKKKCPNLFKKYLHQYSNIPGHKAQLLVPYIKKFSENPSEQSENIVKQSESSPGRAESFDG